MIRIVTVKFRNAGKHYDFAAGDLDLHPGDFVIVETDRGRALGSIVYFPREIAESEAPDNLKQVLRPASDKDLQLADESRTREKEAFQFCMERIQARQMEMKLVKAEYLFDASKIIFFFTADGRVDFRELVKDLAHHFHTRIEMRQIGVRDEAKLTGGLGVCGRELCCCTFLSNFAPVSVKMAKEQGLALNPNKISGQCGRLLCCLNYEYETYRDLKKGLPKCGRKVQVEDQTGEVVNQNVLAHTVTVMLPDNRSVEIPADDILPIESPAEPPSSQESQQRVKKPGGRSQGSRRKPRDGDERKPEQKIEGQAPPEPSQEKSESENPPRRKSRRRGRGKGRSQQKNPSGDQNG
ncbi:MAG: stage 0 sporulation family protein [Syntrophotaleaceae bacterium]